MPDTTLAAEERTEFGKGAARRVRRAHKVPAVLYGHGNAPRHLSLPGHDLMLALKHGGANALLTLQLSDGEQLALPKAVVRDPIRGFLEHVDLIVVRRGEKVTVDVPVTLIGETASDVLITQPLSTLSVEAEATHLPTAFELDVSGLTAGDNILASAVSLPAGTTLIGDPEAVVVSALAPPTAEQLEEALTPEGVDTDAASAGEGDVVPDTDSGEGGPATPADASAE